MRLKISVLLIVAMLCVALTGMASAADVKCAWEPCGEKVEQAEIDAVYALTPADMQIMYTDVNSNNRFDKDDVLFIDGIIDTFNPDRFEVEVGDVRLTDSCGTYQPNTKVVHGDNEIGQTLKQLPGGQTVVGFVDVNNDGVYDLSDPLYVETDLSGTVTVNDVRLTARDGYPAYSRVAIGDSDITDVLLDPVTYTVPLATPITVMLGYIDSDCSTTWTCVDKLYLQQMTRGVDGTVNGCVADMFVTIGDFRLYIPQVAIDEEGWPSCGTKVKQADIDAVYVLTPAMNMQIMYTDVNSNDRFDQDDVLFIDGLMDPLAGGFEVEVGDVRLTDSCGTYDPNTKVVHGDKEIGQTLKPLPAGQMVVGFVDVNNDGVYDLSDPLYVETDLSGTVTVNDVRLTATEGYPAYSRVAIGDSDITDVLLDPVTYTAPLMTPINTMIGFIDSDCSTTWTCVDKLYLQQITGTIADNLVTIGDFRLYIPQVAIAEEGWPSCGTKVEQCDIDAVYVLTAPAGMRIMYTDVNSNSRFDQDDVLFIDGLIDLDEVEVGDVRLTDSCGTYDPNTKVVHGDKEVGQTLKQLPGGQTVVGFVDVNNDGVYDLSDPLYVDTDSSGAVSVHDVRLTATQGYSAYSRVMIGDTDIKDVLLDTVTLTAPLVTPINDMLGYIDVDCSTTWTCVDKLYLQQMAGQNAPAKDLVVTIGDFRVYIQPWEIGEDDTDYNVYDENQNNEIEIGEMMDAIGDWKKGDLSIGDMMDVIGYWKAGSY